MRYNLIILFALIGTAVIFANTYTQQADALASRTIPQNIGMKMIPKPTGYLGGSFVSSGKIFALSTVGASSAVSNPSIQQGSSGGFLSFLFSSSSYGSSAFSVSYQSCDRSFIAADSGTANGVSGLHQSCTPVKPLGFSYGKNSQDQYTVTTKSVTLPCGNVQTIDGQSLPMKYDLAVFSVKTINSPSALPYSYDYVIYSHC